MQSERNNVSPVHILSVHLLKTLRDEAFIKVPI